MLTDMFRLHTNENNNNTYYGKKKFFFGAISIRFKKQS